MIVDGTNLSMTRGDSETITVKIKDLPFSDGDIIEMTVRKNLSQDATKIFHKKITSFDAAGSALIEIEPEDTSSCSFGKYAYDIQWTNSDGKVKTIVKPSMGNFVITSEVTY